MNLAGATAGQTSSPPVDAKAAQQDSDAAQERGNSYFAGCSASARHVNCGARRRNGDPRRSPESAPRFRPTLAVTRLLVGVLVRINGMISTLCGLVLKS